MTASKYTPPPRDLTGVYDRLDWMHILLHLKCLDGFNIVGVLNNKYNMKKACLNLFDAFALELK